MLWIIGPFTEADNFLENNYFLTPLPVLTSESYHLLLEVMVTDWFIRHNTKFKSVDRLRKCWITDFEMTARKKYVLDSLERNDFISIWFCEFVVDFYSQWEKILDRQFMKCHVFFSPGRFKFFMNCVVLVEQMRFSGNGRILFGAQVFVIVEVCLSICYTL